MIASYLIASFFDGKNIREQTDVHAQVEGEIKPGT